MKKAIISTITLICIFMFLPSVIFAAKLSEADLAKKEEGWYPTGLPLVNFSSDDGFGYGVRAYLYNNGTKDQPYFDSTPYFFQLYAQYFATTNGVQYHELNLDMPYVAGSKFRIKTAFVYNKELNANYFGIGEDAAQDKLIQPGTPSITYSKWEDYQEFIDENKQFFKYYNYTITKPKYYLYLFRDMTEEITFMGGAEFKHVDVKSWDGRDFKNNTQAITKLTEDRNAGGATGFSGGWTNYARFAIGYDTRDFEPDPKNGVYVDYCYEISNSTLGSAYDFMKHNAGARYYVNVVDSLVFAFRLGYTTASGDIPFYEMSWFGFAQSRQEGLGANRTLRGYKKNRFVGKTMTLANAEARWQFYEVSGAGQRFGFQLLGFYDAGNVYDEAAGPFSDPRWEDYHSSYGGGLVIAWNLSTIVHFLYGMSKEDSSISIDFEHAF